MVLTYIDRGMICIWVVFRMKSVDIVLVVIAELIMLRMETEMVVLRMEPGWVVLGIIYVWVLLWMIWADI